jgi:hypothetical protein
MIKPEKRRSPVRRQFNESFCDQNGNFSMTKTIAIASLVMLLYHTGKSFDKLIPAWDSLMVCLSFLICPDLIKKWLTMKYSK